MSHTPAPAASFDEVRQRVRDLRESRKQASVKGAASPDAEDPTLKGTVTTPNHPDGDDPAKTGLPNQSRPQNTTEVDDGVTVTGGTGEDVPPVAKTTGYTTEGGALSKAAAPLQATVQRLAALRQKTHAAKEAKAAAPTSTPAAAPPTEAATDKQANTQTADAPALTDTHYIKLASEILACQEGIDLVRDFLTKRAGEKAAAQMIADALDSQRAFEKYAADQQAFAKQAFEHDVNETTFFADQLLKASPEERLMFAKCAHVHQTALAQIPDPILQEFSKAGAVDAGMMEDLSAAAGPEATEAPVLPGADPAGPSDEQIEQVVSALVAQGALDPTMAEQILAGLGGGMPGGDAAAMMGGGLPPEAGGAAPDAGAAPEESAAEGSEETKEASVTRAFGLANQLISAWQ